MFRIGYDGTASQVTPSLNIIGGRYNNYTSINTWLDVDESYSVKLYGPHVSLFATVIKATANTLLNAISVFGNSNQGNTTFYSGPAGKLTGVYCPYSLNEGNGNQLRLIVSSATVTDMAMLNSYYTPVAVAALPTVSSTGAGAKAFVDNASVNTFGSVPVTSSTALASVAITGTAGQFSCTAATLQIGMALKISGTFGGTGSITGYTDPKIYYVIATNGSTTFTLSATAGGTAITTTAGTPTGLTYLIGYMVPVYSDGTSWRIG